MRDNWYIVVNLILAHLKKFTELTSLIILGKVENN